MGFGVHQLGSKPLIWPLFHYILMYHQYNAVLSSDIWGGMGGSWCDILMSLWDVPNSELRVFECTQLDIEGPNSSYMNTR